MHEKTYIAIDLKSFYASVECVERGLDALTTNLVVADESRTEKTICLAVSPSLKAYGIPGRPRLFEVISKVNQINNARRRLTPGKMFSGRSVFDAELKRDPYLAVDYITAPPRMALYIDYSTRIYEIYLRYIAPENIHVYSVDEVFIDATDYLKAYKKTARELAAVMIGDVLCETGITATAGIGTNLYLAKIAMDIVAKHMPADKNGVRIAKLSEMSYRRMLWEHTPITDFWRVGRGIAKRLEENGMFTMGDVARRSLEDYALFYRLFGVNAELLVDHAWGTEPCTIEDIKAYKPRSNSISSGQVLSEPYPYQKARIIVREMADAIALDLTEKRLVTNQIVLTIGYDAENITGGFCGEYTVDFYGRPIPKHAHGTINLPKKTSSARLISQGAITLFDKIINESFTVRRVNITACNMVSENFRDENGSEQLTLFTEGMSDNSDNSADEREREMQRAIIEIKKKYGKNAVIKAMDLQDGATAISRNSQIGGHKA
ncbi:MAG: DNA methylase [Oscillospiraceae bacterium]|nr:DNA methylase [Oscillospiraceae bacterium]